MKFTKYYHGDENYTKNYCGFLGCVYLLFSFLLLFIIFAVITAFIVHSFNRLLRFGFRCRLDSSFLRLLCQIICTIPDPFICFSSH